MYNLVWFHKASLSNPSPMLSMSLSAKVGKYRQGLEHNLYGVKALSFSPFCCNNTVILKKYLMLDKEVEQISIILTFKSIQKLIKPSSEYL